MAQQFDHWWQGVPALPLSRQDHDYEVLRRVWDDHTMSGSRGFYNPRSEDHLTVSLFHGFAALSRLGWACRLLARLGIEASVITRARFAYACEEVLDAALASRHGRNFIIPDIVLCWEDDAGRGLLAFEVKKPGGPGPAEQDFVKLRSYADLPSMRHIPRRHSAFVLDRKHVDNARLSGALALSWDDVLELQVESLADEPIPDDLRTEIGMGLRRHFAAAGVGSAPPAPVPDLTHVYARAAALAIPERLKALLCGLAINEARRAGGIITAPPFPWLAAEPDIAMIRSRKRQTTAERRLNRWSLGAA